VRGGGDRVSRLRVHALAVAGDDRSDGRLLELVVFSARVLIFVLGNCVLVGRRQSEPETTAQCQIHFCWVGC
jgi:hypothetical protein